VDLSRNERHEILLVELKALQDRFTKFDDLTWKTRSWSITLVSAILGWVLKDGLQLSPHKDLLFLAVSIAVLFWLQEGFLRIKNVHKYAVRYRRLRTTINDRNTTIESIPLYDLTNHIEGRPPSNLCTILDSFFRAEQSVFYVLLAAIPVLLYWIANGHHFC